jgi:hypothetical protein
MRRTQNLFGGKSAPFFTPAKKDRGKKQKEKENSKSSSLELKLQHRYLAYQARKESPPYLIEKSEVVKIL